MRRIYLDRFEIKNGKIFIFGSAVHYVGTVLRKRKGDSFCCFDGRGTEYVVCVSEIGKQCLEGVIVNSQFYSLATPNSYSRSEPDKKFILCQSIPKGAKMDGIIKAVSQLGVCRIVPVFSERCVVRHGAGISKQKTIRWKKISEDGAKVSGRTIVPEISPSMSFCSALEIESDCTIVFWEEERTPLEQICLNVNSMRTVKIFIGPEGGYSEKEITLAVEHGAHSSSLGPRILRTETAAIVAITLVLHEFGEI